MEQFSKALYKDEDNLARVNLTNIIYCTTSYRLFFSHHPPFLDVHADSRHKEEVQGLGQNGQACAAVQSRRQA